ncbi:MAG: hypothetical protein KDN22_30115 [Verrucomicrobiae bacterium]|nr:hypothetical protein [Verrucomicrobiae bacterium]
MISDARGRDDYRATDGLRQLALNYWRPLYVFLRKQGETHEDASDSVQGFFEHILGSGFLSHVDREGGKFRSYLLKSLTRWRSRERIRQGAIKRGGLVRHVCIDEIPVEELENELDLEGDESPETAFDRQWALEMVGRAVDSLSKDYERRGRSDWFRALRPGLPGSGEMATYAELAAELHTTEGAIKKAAFDLRGAFANRLKEEIRSTVRSKEDAEEELRHLVAALSS